jgi:hypothetical protein
MKMRRRRASDRRLRGSGIFGGEGGGVRVKLRAGLTNQSGDEIRPLAHARRDTSIGEPLLPSTQRDLFTPVIPADKLNPLFRYAAQDPGHAGARAMANAVFANLRDVDGTFLREFQAAGFSARVFELALFGYLEEQDLELDRTHPAPDFVVRGDLPVAIEVTTTNPAQDTPLDPGPPYTLVPDDLEAADAEFVFQLGKALRRKLLHRDAQDRAYWEKPHVAGLPFVIAVGAFHGPHAQIHPDGLLASYLYGVRSVAYHDETGKLTITPENVTEHHSASKTIPSGLFRHPEAANLAGVLFSNAHTISKFNRIGIEQGFGTADTALMRFGTCYDYDPDALKPLLFSYVVGDRPPGTPRSQSGARRSSSVRHLLVRVHEDAPKYPPVRSRCCQIPLSRSCRLISRSRQCTAGVEPVTSTVSIVIVFGRTAC